VTPDVGGDGITTVLLADPLPTSFEAEVLFNADDATAERASNAFLIFDYQSPTNFKFAGAYIGIDEWLIGHRDASGWVTDLFASGPIDANTDYTMRVEVHQGGLVQLFAGGVLQATVLFVDDPTDGEVGIGTKNAITRFDDYSLLALGGTQSIALGPAVAPPATGGPRFATPGDGDLAARAFGFGHAAMDGDWRVAPAVRAWQSGNVRAVKGPVSLAGAKDRALDEWGESGGFPGWMLPGIDSLTASPLV
jgi:hypothetical protein